MAKLTLSIDTEEQTASVDVDGVAVTNLSEVSIYNYNYDGKDAYNFQVCTMETVGGVRKYVRLMASESPQATQARATGTGRPSLKYPGFTEMDCLTKAQEGMVSMYGRLTKP